MKYKILLTERFVMPLAEMGDYIACDNPRRANSWVKEVEKRVMQLDVFPEAQPYARENDHYNIDLRQLVFGRGINKYRIIYTMKVNEVVVLDIRHSARNEHGPDAL